MRRAWTTTALLLGLLVAESRGQVADQVVVLCRDGLTNAPSVLRFGRDLSLKGKTMIPQASEFGVFGTPIVVDGVGRYWIGMNPLSQATLLRLDSAGTQLPSALLGHNPVYVTASAWDTVYALTRIPLQSPAPMYAVGGDGEVLWSSMAGPQNYFGWYPLYAATASTGQLWIAGHTEGACGCVMLYPCLTRLDPATGVVLGRIFPPTEPIIAPSVLFHMSAAPDGTLWVAVNQFGNKLHQFDETGVLKTFLGLALNNSATGQIRVDPAGDIWAVSSLQEPNKGGWVRRYSQEDGSVLDVQDFGDTIIGFAFGASGQDLFAVTNSKVVPLQRRLARINLATGVRSTIPLNPDYTMGVMANGDPTGFIYANVVDQQGDNDGDGSANREEILAGSSPYDSSSRPNGPRVSIDFATSNNALILRLSDPDGLLDPAAGLDVPTLSVEMGPFGEVLPILLPFLSFVDVSLDGTQVTAVFGALPLASELKWQIDVRVADLTGAVGWDWQITPPGDL